MLSLSSRAYGLSAYLLWRDVFPCPLPTCNCVVCLFLIKLWVLSIACVNLFSDVYDLQICSLVLKAIIISSMVSSEAQRYLMSTKSPKPCLFTSPFLSKRVLWLKPKELIWFHVQEQRAWQLGCSFNVFRDKRWSLFLLGCHVIGTPSARGWAENSPSMKIASYLLLSWLECHSDTGPCFTDLLTFRSSYFQFSFFFLKENFYSDYESN